MTRDGSMRRGTDRARSLARSKVPSGSYGNAGYRYAGAPLEEERRSVAGRVLQALMIIVFSLFTLALLLVLLGGSQIFRTVHAAGAETDRARLAISLVANAVHAHDAADAVSVEDGPEGDVLVLTEHLASGTYETRFYLDDGWLIEEYAPAESDLDPARGTRIIPQDRFDATLHRTEQGSSVELETDTGRAVVALRSNRALAGDAS